MYDSRLCFGNASLGVIALKAYETEDEEDSATFEIEKGGMNDTSETEDLTINKIIGDRMKNSKWHPSSKRREIIHCVR